jgi:hypothetical protein
MSQIRLQDSSHSASFDVKPRIVARFAHDFANLDNKIEILFRSMPIQDPYCLKDDLGLSQDE